MNAAPRILLPFVVALLLAPLTACALSGKAVEGRVLEEGTNKPVPEAIVVARWIGTAFSFVESPSVCVHVLTTTTDVQGQYRFPAWRKESPLKGVRDVRPVITTHKPGYEEYRAPGYAYTEEFKRNIRYLKPFTGGREERLKYIERVFGSTGCGTSDGSDKNSIPFVKALYDEAKSLAQTPEEKRMLEFFLYGLEDLELGFEEAQKRHLERVKDK